MNFKSDSFNVEVYSSLSGREKNWNEIPELPSHLRSSFLLALENARPADLEFRYVVVLKGQVPVAAAYLQIVNFTGQNFSEKNSSLVLRPASIFFRLKKVRLMFCGNLFRVQFRAYHLRDAEISFSQLADILQEVRSNEKCQLLMMKEVRKGDDEAELLSHRFARYDEDMTMALILDKKWNSFDDYCSTLTKKYRKRLQLIRGKRKELTVSRLPPEELRLFLHDIGRLFNETADRQFLKMGIIDEKYFESMQVAFEDCFFVNGYFLDGRLIAFASHLIHNDMLEVHYIGINYEQNDKYALYFNILYDGLEQAISLRKKMLELGRTARDAKASVGCLPVSSNDYLFVKSPVIRKLIGLFENVFKERMGDTWMVRNPFKVTK